MSQHNDCVNRYFTNRVLEKEKFKTELDNPLNIRNGKPDYRILVWHGPGGQGKTGLREEFYDEIRSRQGKGEKIAAGVLDFAYEPHRDPINALLQLRLDLGRDRMIIFPFFDLAFAQHFAYESRGGDIRTAHPGLYRGEPNEIVEDFLDWVDAVARVAAGIGMPFIPGMGLLYKYGQRLYNQFCELRDCQAITSHRAEIDALSASEIREMLPTYLGRDLQQAMKAEYPPRVVLIADAYEQLFDARDTLQTRRNDNWVRSLVDHTQGALVTIFSRQELSWAKNDRKWEKILEQESLKDLSGKDADLFLKEEHVEPASVRSRIVECAQGHPFYLDLAINQFHDLVAKDHRPEPDDFGVTPGEVLPRFLEHLSDDELKQLRYASYTEEISETLFCDLAEKFLGGAACVDWSQLIRRSFMRLNDNGRASMHALMRNDLQELECNDRTKLYHDVHDWLFKRYDALADSAKTARDIGEDHDRALLCAAQHLACADVCSLPSWILDERWQKFYEASRWHALSDTFDVVSNKCDSFSEPDSAVWVYHHHAHVCQYMGLDDDARNLFERALDAYKAAALNDSDPKYATILHALGDLSRKMGNEAEAEALFARALDIYQTAPGVYDQRHADVLFSLALIREANGQEDEAMTYYRKAQVIYQATLGEQNLDYAKFLLKLGRAHQHSGRYDEAEILFRKALDIYKATRGERYPGYATTLLDLSDCLAIRGKRIEAEAGYEQSVSTYMDTLGPEHINLAQALHHQARFWIEDDSKREVATAQLEHAIAMLVAERGNEHTWTMEARKDLHRLQPTTGESAIEAHR